MKRHEGIAVGVAGLALLFVCGCSDAEKPVAGGAGGVEFAYPSVINPSIAPESPIVLVNGVAITRRDFDRWVSLRARVYCLSRQLELTAKRNHKLEMYVNTTQQVALTDLIRRELIRQACEKKALVVPDSAVAAAQKAFMRGIRKPKESFEKYAGTLSAAERELLVRQVTADARGDFFLRQWATNDFTSVSDAEVSNRLDFVRNYEANVTARNEAARKKAAEAKAEILAGASFYSVTTNRAEIFQEQGKEWDVVGLDELEPEEDLFKFLAGAKQGDISDPLDFDDGIGIVGVVSKELEDVPEGEAAAEQYTLVRCMFNAYVSLDEPEDFNSMRELLVERKTAAAREAMMNDLLKDAKIELPAGDRLFAAKKKKKKHSAPAKKRMRAKRKKP